MLDFNAEIEPRQPFGIVFGTRNRPDDVEQFFFCQTDERAAQQGPEGECVPAVGENTRQRDQILDLLTAEQAFSCLCGDRDAVAFERLFVSPKITAGGREQRNVAWPARSTGAGATIEDHLTANQPGAHLGDCVGFTVALLLG